MLGEREKRLQRLRAQARRVIGRYIPIGSDGYYVARERAITALLDLQRGGCDLELVMPEIEKLTQDSDPEVSSAARFVIDMLVRDGRTIKNAEQDGAANGSQPIPPETNPTTSATRGLVPVADSLP